MRRHAPSMSPQIISESFGAGRLASWPWPRCQEEPAPRVLMKPPLEHPVVRQLAGAPMLIGARGLAAAARAAAASGLTSSWRQASWGQASWQREQPSQRGLSSVQLWPFASPRCSKTYLLESDRHESTGPCANSYQIFQTLEEELRKKWSFFLPMRWKLDWMNNRNNSANNILYSENRIV